ncbi:MAG: 3-hydroxyacyl-CoA dehydrogenase family protein, partial [Solirubrobacterales bacterium]
MHFFNPAPLMKLVEVVPGPDTDGDVVELVENVAERLGRTPVRARDYVGFIANRVHRPFTLEALKIVGESQSEPPTVDRICRLGAGFKMGPFELMDLIGIDVSLEVSESFYEQSFHEPRWRPHPIQSRYVSSGRLGRKSGRGFYHYDDDGAYRDPDPDPPDRGGGEGVVVVEGSGPIASELRDLASDAGYEIRSTERLGNTRPEMLIDAARVEPRSDISEGGLAHTQPTMQASASAINAMPRAVSVLLTDSDLAGADAGRLATGFYVLPPLSDNRLVEVARAPLTTPDAAERSERFFRTLGFDVEWVADAPGLVLGRIVCMIVNEACFALTAGVAGVEAVDTAMQNGLNYPDGPLHWADRIGIDHILGVLDALHAHFREERYRASPVLRQMVAQGRLGCETGQGFYGYT